MRWVWLGVWALGVGCSGKGDCAEGAAASTGGDAVALTTQDGLCLVADHYRGDALAPAVVLLHMNPEQWTRKSWPVQFISDMQRRGWTVLNVDRRGAGDSEGAPKDAFEGPGGFWDVQAAVRYLYEQDVAMFSIVAASNGTTSAADYAVGAAAEGDIAPVSMVFMSGGTYTENQTPIEGLADTHTPLLFQADDVEQLWFDNLDDINPGEWEYSEYAGAGHGSQMLDHTPDVEADILDFLVHHWPERL